MKRYDVKASTRYRNLLQGCSSHLTVRELHNLIYIDNFRSGIKYRERLEKKYKKLNRCSARHGTSMAMAGIIEARMSDVGKRAIQKRLRKRFAR